MAALLGPWHFLQIFMSDKKTYIDDPKEKHYVDLVNRKIDPTTQEDKELMKQVEQVEKEGGVVEIPSDV